MSFDAATAPRAGFSVFVLAFVLLGGIVSRASAQVIEPQAKRTPVPFSQMRITPASLSFKQITFGKTAPTESGSLTIRNIGTAPLTVNIGNPATLNFSISQGQVQSILPPKGLPLAVTVRFAPHAAGTFRDVVPVSSNATRGKAAVSLALKGAAKGVLPTPTRTRTATATRTPTPTATATGTATSTPTTSATSTRTATGTVTPTPTATVTRTPTPTVTITTTPTATASPTPTATVAVTAPLDGASAAGLVPITIASASSVAFVNVYIDGSYLASTPPSTLNWNSTTATNGSHQILATAYAANSAVLGSVAIHVTVQNGPTKTATETATATPTPTPSGAFFTGHVSVNGVPVGGATITFYAVGNTGYGSSAVALDTTSTASDGTYTVPYTCPSGNIETYVVATGGNAGSGSNPAIGLTAPIGPCGGIKPSTIVVVNELTTAAAETALAQFIDSTGAMIGASSTNSSGLSLGFINYYNLVAVASSADFSVSGRASSFLPTAEQCASQSPPPNCDGLERLDTLANIVTACASSSGPDSSPCNALFTQTSTSSSKTTLAAMHVIALNPTLDLNSIFAIQSMISSQRYQPALTTPPEGFEIALTLAVGNGVNSANTALAIDSAGNLLVVGFDGLTSASAMNELVAANGYAAGVSVVPGISVADGASAAIDASDNVFLTSRDSNAIGELTAASGYLSGTIFTPGGAASFNRPQSIALDKDGNIFVANNPPGGTSGRVSELVASGDFSTGFNFASADASLTCPVSLALDLSSNIFVANCDNTISELTFASGYGSGSSFNLISPDGQSVALAQSSIGLDTNSNLFVLTTGLLSGGISWRS